MAGRGLQQLAQPSFAAFVMLAHGTEAHTHHLRRLVERQILVKDEVQSLRLPRGQFFQRRPQPRRLLVPLDLSRRGRMMLLGEAREQFPEQ